MDSTKLVLGVLAGVAVGATLGILFAPDKGSETRRKLAGKGGEYIDQIEDKFNDFIDTVTAKLDDLKEEASGVAVKELHKVEGSLDEASAAIRREQKV